MIHERYNLNNGSERYTLWVTEFHGEHLPHSEEDSGLRCIWDSYVLEDLTGNAELWKTLTHEFNPR